MEKEVRRHLSVFELKARQCRFAAPGALAAHFAELDSAAKQLQAAARRGKQSSGQRGICAYWLKDFGCPELYAARVMAELRARIF